MDKRHPHADATYRIIPSNLAFRVEISIPDMQPVSVTGFRTAADAVSWVTGHKSRVIATTSLKAKRFGWRR